MTAASGQYETTLMSEMAKSDAPTLFQVNGPVGLANWKDYCYDLTGSKILGDLTSDSYALKDGDATVAIGYVIESYGLITNKTLLEKAGYKPNAAATNIGSAIFANKPGDGSAREQAASCQRVLGGAANFAKEYATKRYRSNCINWGMLPFLVEDPSVFELGDCIYLPGVRKALLEAADTMPAVAVKPDGSVKEFTVKLGALTDAERQILADGCLINYYKNN